MDSTRGLEDTGGAAARSSEAMRIKDEQLRMLQEQNARLLSSLDTFEAEISTLTSSKGTLEDENRRLKENVFELQTKMGATEASRARMSAEVTDKDKQLKTIAAQNSELLRLLEAQEDKGGTLEAEVRKLQAANAELSTQLASHGAAARQTDERNQGLHQELMLRSEEVRIARLESDQLRAALADAQRTAAVEIDSLQEALRVRKEKQYSLLEKTAAAEEIARKNAEEVAQLKQALGGAHARVTELETRLAMEERARKGQADNAKALGEEGAAMRAAMVEVQARLEKSDGERLRLEAELRTSGEQLKDMADKVFALLERLKLAELGKTKAVEALKAKDAELAAVKKRAEKAAKEAVKESKARAQVEVSLSQLAEEIETLRAHNSTLAAKLKDESKRAVREHEDREGLEEKTRVLSARVAFLLNKLAGEEESHTAARQDIKRLEEQLKAATERAEEGSKRSAGAEESVRALTAALRERTEGHDSLVIRFNALLQRLKDGKRPPPSEKYAVTSEGTMPGVSEDGEEGGATNNNTSSSSAAQQQNEAGPDADGGDDDDGGAGGAGGAGDIGLTGAEERERAAESVEPNNAAVVAAQGKGRFYLEPKPTQGLLLVRGERRTAKLLLQKLGVNDALRRAQASKPAQYRERMVRLVCNLLGLLLVSYEERDGATATAAQKEAQAVALARVNDALQSRIAGEEEVRRQMVSRYVAMVVAAAVNAAQSAASMDPRSPAAAAAASGVGAPTLHLDSMALGDEGTHAVVAAVRSGLSASASASGGAPGTADGSAPWSAQSTYGTPATAHISELYMRGNSISDDGARALSSLLAQAGADAHGDALRPLAIRMVDLRGNHISKAGVRALAEALEASPRVQHVYVHAGGRIEALGARTYTLAGDSQDGSGAGAGDGSGSDSQVVVETLCVVDVRDQLSGPPPAAYIADRLLHVSEATPVDSAAMAAALQQAPPLTRTLADITGIGGPGATINAPYNARPPSSPVGAGSNAVAALRRGFSAGSTSGSSVGFAGDGDTGAIAALLEQEQREAAARAAAEREAARSRHSSKAALTQMRKEAGWQGRAGGMDVVPMQLAEALGINSNGNSNSARGPAAATLVGGVSGGGSVSSRSPGQQQQQQQQQPGSGLSGGPSYSYSYPSGEPDSVEEAVAAAEQAAAELQRFLPEADRRISPVRGGITTGYNSAADAAAAAALLNDRVQQALAAASGVVGPPAPAPAPKPASQGGSKKGADQQQKAAAIQRLISTNPLAKSLR